MIHKCEIDVQILMLVHALKTVVAFYYIIINTFFKFFIALIICQRETEKVFFKKKRFHKTQRTIWRRST